MQPSEIKAGQLLECRGREVQCVTDASTAAVGDADSDAVAFIACVGLLVADGVVVRVSVSAATKLRASLVKRTGQNKTVGKSSRVAIEGPVGESSNVVAVLVDSSAGVLYLVRKGQRTRHET